MSQLLTGIVIVAASGFPGLLLGRRSAVGQYAATLLSVAGSVLGIAGAIAAATTVGGAEWRRPWVLPGAEFHVGVDGLSLVFLMPVFFISLCGSIYDLAYWKQAEHPQNGRKLRMFYGLLTAAMALLIVARNGLLFLYGWELMALSAYFLVTTEDDREDVREAGWIYLAATHTGTLILFGLFALLRAATGTFDLVPVSAEALSPAALTLVFVLALLGFGLKAGLMPLHVWLPGAHAAAPSHVSALMSGVIIKMGIYGLVRVLSLLPTPPTWPGALLLALGSTSGVLGVAFAVGQHDLKRLLAYHSIENIGIIVMGIGLAMIGRALDRPAWIALGMGGALLHTWNHAIFKSLLFYGAGSVQHAAHTREIDELGGLAKTMPRTAFCFLVGAAAICGLPPLNGFVSELLIYLGLFQTLGLDGGRSYAGASLAAPVLALIGALALACFVKAFGIVFLGSPRSRRAAEAVESPTAMTGPMFLLVGCCAVIGLAPNLTAPVLERGIAAWLPGGFADGVRLGELAPLGWISAIGLLLVGGTALIGGWLLARLRRLGAATTCTWGCGYAAPTPRMQYTSSSLAQMLVNLMSGILRPHVRRTPVRGLFPDSTAYAGEVDDVVLKRFVLPSAERLADRAAWFRRFHQGSTQIYLSYILAVLFLTYLWQFRVYQGWLMWRWIP